MRGKKWLVLAASLAVVLLANSIGLTGAFFFDLESSSGNSFQAWTSECWTQTTEVDFNRGILENVTVFTTEGGDGDVKLAINPDFGDGSDGDVTISSDSDTTLTRDMNYRNLIIESGVTLDTAGYTVRVLETLTNNGIITDSESGGSGGAGGAGGAGHEGDGNGEDGLAGGPGSLGSGRAGAGGAGGGGGGGGAGQSVVSHSVTGGKGGDGGAGGKGGGDVKIYCYELVNNGVIHADGFAGSSGQDGGDGEYESWWLIVRFDIAPGGGGGGNGGDGGTVSITYAVLTANGTIRADGGAGGSGGSGGAGRDTLSWLPGGTEYSGGSGAGNGGDGGKGEEGRDYSEDGADGGAGSFGTSGTVNLDQVGYYITPGTIASQVLDTETTGARWDALFWDETLPSGTDITFEVRASDTEFAKDATTPSWTSVGGTSPVTSGLPSGRYKQWRATLTTSDTSKTPILHEVRVYWSDP